MLSYYLITLVVLLAHTFSLYMVCKHLFVFPTLFPVFLVAVITFDVANRRYY